MCGRVWHMHLNNTTKFDQCDRPLLTAVHTVPCCRREYGQL